MQIFFCANPRSFILVSNEYALTLRYLNRKEHCLIQYSPLNQTDLSKHKEITSLTFYGLVGLLNFKRHVFFCIITDQKLIGSPRPSEDIYKIKDVEFYCLNSTEFDNITIGRFRSKSSTEKYDLEHPCSKIRKFLTSGFYYSRDFDLTCHVQERSLQIRDYQQMFNNYDKRFLWNTFMIQELLSFRDRILDSERYYLDRSELLTFLIRGFAKTYNTVFGDEDSLLTIISRISCAKSGSPFGSNGIDEDGHVSNYIDSEIILYNKSLYFAYDQVRGNVPLFYEVENSILSNKKIHMTQTYEMNKSAFDKHFEFIVSKYGNVVILNSLKQKAAEGELSHKYEKLADKRNIPFVNLDFGKEKLKLSPHKVTHLIEKHILEIGAFCYDIKKKVYTGKQLGIFRVNALDNVIKPGIIEKIVSKEVLSISMNELTGHSLSHDLRIKHDFLWDESNDVLDAIHEQSFRKHYKKAFEGISKSLVKLHDPIHDFISSQLQQRQMEYSTQREIKIFTSTFNVAASTTEEDLTSWIFPDNSSNDVNEGKTNNDYDLVAIGLEEIVELTTSKMLTTDNSKKMFWESMIKKTLNSHSSETGNKYSLLWSVQLGGILLIVFSKKDHLDDIKHIEGVVKKTGFGGISANKGGAAISLSFSSTNFCFIVSHLAAGLENNAQRLVDFKTIYKSIRFKGDKTILAHEISIWMGDFNSRIDRTNDQVREAIFEKNLSYLLEEDQLSKDMDQNKSFQFFIEKDITFPPTYKFDKGTDNYDTSEKFRIPAWTDRILAHGKSNHLKQLSYDSVPEIKFSDHRPVYATFKAMVTIIQEDIKNELTKELYEKRKLELERDQNTILSKTIEDSVDSGNANNLTSDLSPFMHSNNSDDDINLPPPSSEKFKWWISNGESVKIQLDIPDNVVINPLRLSNPFKESENPNLILYE
ncbi:hypothetical protein WICMUC_002162 [Wickerhamomyces mucosus]|uniref:phosphoinositide 5-phosphatase n=1 Tax=Wickerhamomyces mucosus TaxID=1378264 RepID=A0A9P8PRB3_9ASCO|nr:hypothetical protein WICMUC_002162 [Wickerhamomyces mucosus]